MRSLDRNNLHCGYIARYGDTFLTERETRLTGWPVGEWPPKVESDADASSNNPTQFELCSQLIDFLIDRAAARTGLHGADWHAAYRQFNAALAWWLWKLERNGPLHIRDIPRTILADCSVGERLLRDNWTSIKRRLIVDCYSKRTGGAIAFRQPPLGAFLLAEHLMQSRALLDRRSAGEKIVRSMIAEERVAGFVRGWISRADRVGGPDLTRGIAGRVFNLVVHVLTSDPLQVDVSALAFARSVLRHGLTLSVETQAWMVLAWAVSVLRRKNCQMFLGSVLAAELISGASAIEGPDFEGSSSVRIGKASNFPLWLFLRCFAIGNAQSEYGQISFDLGRLIVLCESEVWQRTGMKLIPNEVGHLHGIRLHYAPADIYQQIRDSDVWLRYLLRRAALGDSLSIELE
jgi:hypothetical protein